MHTITAVAFDQNKACQTRGLKRDICSIVTAGNYLPEYLQVINIRQGNIFLGISQNLNPKYEI